MKVKLAKSDSELERASEILLQLRTGFTKESLIARIKAQQRSGYQIAYVEADGKALCVAGFVVAQKLAWGKHLYIDDLVTAERHRSTGTGKVIIDWLKSYAQALGCKELHLDSGVQRFAAHRFYLREGFSITGHHFAISDSTS